MNWLRWFSHRVSVMREFGVSWRRAGHEQALRNGRRCREAMSITLPPKRHAED